MKKPGSLGRRQRGRGWLVALALGVIWSAKAADWPQYRGANHDATSSDRITLNWRGTVTNAVWKVPITNGFCSLAVSGGRVYTQIRRKISSVNREVCLALNATNGAELWATPIEDASYDGGTGIDAQDGPRTTPTVYGGAVFVLSSHLKLAKLNATNGAVLWATNLLAGYGGDLIGWQNGASPVVDGGLLFVNVNCADGTLMAIRASDGKEAWRSQSGETNTHASPVVATIAGKRQVLFASESGVVSLDPDTGERLWKFDYPFRFSTSLAVSPTVHQDRVFISGAYSMGSAVAQVSFSGGTWSTTQLWHSTGLQSHWMTPVCYQGHLYGQFGSSSTSPFKCIEMATGAEKWSTSGFGRAGAVLVNDRIVTLTEQGNLVLIEPNTNSYKELGRFKAVNSTCWNSPAVCDGRVYVRSTTEGALFNLSIPDLKVNSPQLLAGNKLRLTIAAADGSSLTTGRLANLEIRATTNLALAPGQWPKLTNAMVLTNGTVRVDNVNAGSQSQRFFITVEPK